MTETLIIAIFTTLTGFGGAVIAYLQNENKKLKSDVQELTSVLYTLVIAIKEDRTIPDTSTLGAKADEILARLEKISH